MFRSYFNFLPLTIHEIHGRFWLLQPLTHHMPPSWLISQSDSPSWPYFRRHNQRLPPAKSGQAKTVQLKYSPLGRESAAAKASNPIQFGHTRCLRTERAGKRKSRPNERSFKNTVFRWALNRGRTRVDEL